MASVTMERRSTWAQYIPLVPERDNGGVFIGERRSFSSGSETTCRRNTAGIFSDHWYEAEGILSYFLVRPHGIIYEGRGRRRGEANGGRLIIVGGRELGRNTAFHSIQGMLGTQDEPKAAMPTSTARLHLRYAFPSAGPGS
ncbi:hypothetical protein [Streptomyces fulvorobeus]|uniref:Uncharacterized protein n=1 Tax=Streptomyces fulvorobeus TaxID=284028 RepID=A0A7J0CCW2_9ACTN|nr:hypothetical protein [Streptomyces fulvorobeus]NYE43874.1 hypothetical protein [Streptomyces fulvorobeus]GFN00366.1 hypothetical protein Sfulv_51760 [Streptomyces fulvorobeus]